MDSPDPVSASRLTIVRRKPATLADRIATLERLIAGLRQQQRDEADGRLLRALALGVRGCVFSVGEVLTRATLDPDLAAAVGGLNGRQLGKRLARVVDRELAGVTVRRVVVNKAGWVWQIDYNHDAGLSG